MPTLEEINMLQDGGQVILTICGEQPAVSLHVEREGPAYTQDGTLLPVGEPHGDVGDRKP
jgi:hypothetical protein